MTTKFADASKAFFLGRLDTVLFCAVKKEWGSKTVPPSLVPKKSAVRNNRTALFFIVMIGATRLSLRQQREQSRPASPRWPPGAAYPSPLWDQLLK